MAIKSGEVLGGHWTYSIIYRTVLMEALLRDTCNARRANASCLIWRPVCSSRLHFSMNFGSRNLKTTSLTVCNNITTKITWQWRHCRVKLPMPINLGIGKGSQRIGGTLGPRSLAMGNWLTLRIMLLSHLCYHAEFGHSRSNRSGQVRGAKGRPTFNTGKMCPP